MCHKGEKKTMRMCAIKEKFKKQHTHVRMKRKKYCHNMQRKEAIYMCTIKGKRNKLIMIIMIKRKLIIYINFVSQRGKKNYAHVRHKGKI